MDSLEPTKEKVSLLKETKGSLKEIDFEKEGQELLTCPKCHHFISGKDINVEKTTAECSNCHHVFGFAYDSATSSLVPELIIPNGIEELKLRSELEFRLKWLSTTSTGGRWFMIMFASFWNIILLPFVIMTVITGNWGILLFLSLHLAVGIGLMWHLASIYFNRTVISVTKHQIKIKTAPIPHPLWKSKTIDTNSISQLYVSRYVQSTSNGVPNYAYALYAILHSGEKVSLVRGMTRETQAFLEQEVETYLGIKNSRVPDEATF